MIKYNKIPDFKKTRAISTFDIDELSQFHVNKNRRYIQLQPGQLQARYLEVNLGDIQVFREELTAGALIEAAPDARFLPFGTVLSCTDNIKYCGQTIQKNSIFQATGGFWDLSFKNDLHYVAAAFNRESLTRNIERLTGQDIPRDWLISKTSLTDPVALNFYVQGLNKIINVSQQNPEVLQKDKALRVFGDSILLLLLDAMSIRTTCRKKKSSKSIRLIGVRKVIDYLHSYSDEVPTIPELCKISNLSERNLQYGFKEYLGVTPIRYLRLQRLNGVRRELLMANPIKDRVVDVALNWGFIELGRFAGEYRQLFQELPSATLNKLN